MDQPIDIGIDLSNTKTAVPLIADGTMRDFRLANVTLVKVEKGNQLKFEWDLVSSAPDSEGGNIDPGSFGSKVFENVALYAKEGAKDPKWFEKRIATRVDNLLGTGDKNNPKGKPERPAVSFGQLVPQLIGKTMTAKVRIRDYEGYRSNEFSQTWFPGDIAS